MYLCYIDETGNRDPRTRRSDSSGVDVETDWLYVITAVCIFEQKWHTFEKVINRHKLELIRRIADRGGSELDLADCEVKSNAIRQPAERQRHRFLSQLTDEEVTSLVDTYYAQLPRTNATILSVLIDKRSLSPGTTADDIHFQSWERLMELIERFMRASHHKHQAIMINDDVDRQTNRRLALNHARLLDKGTSRDTWLRHICEMPMFVRSELSAGVQLVDLCGYNIYRAFRYARLDYPFFQRIVPFIWSPHDRPPPGQRPFGGLFLDDSTTSAAAPLLRQFEKEQALARWGQGLGGG